MTTLTTGAARLQADQATAATLASAGSPDRVGHYLDIEDEQAAHARLGADALAQLDAEMAAAETGPEVTGDQAAAARAEAAAAVLSWLRGPDGQAQAEAEAG